MKAVVESFSSGGAALPLEIYMPIAAGQVPAVLVLHGSFGMLPRYRPDIESFAEALTECGIAAALPHYFEATGTVPGDAVFGQIRSKHPSWRRACADALAAIADDARFDSALLGVLGFSLGGFLALSLAMDPPASATVRAVADFFGPSDLLDPHWSRLPPVLIFHGSADRLVNPSHSAHVVSELKKVGRQEGTDLQYRIMPGEGHGFHGAALDESRDRTIEFFQANLVGG